jgi:hypothetical protein
MKNLFTSGLMALLLSVSITAKAQVPVLNSLPSASAVIFLDFDGHTVVNTAWNIADPIYCGPSGLNNTQITEVFDRVAEDYRPFNINITTDSTKFLAAPLNKRMRVIVTITSDWYGSAGGVAYVGSFVWGDDTPCFVFSALLGYNPKNVSEAASHEAGHTLGLFHQAVYDVNCVQTTQYNPGQGTGEIGWAPIMGVGYYKNMTLWNNGPNPFGCTSFQSDLDIITNVTNGFSFRNDDYAASFAGATNAPFVNNQFITNGIIEQNTDEDMFKFTTLVYGRFQLNAVPYNVGSGNSGSDLDMQVTLYNNSQTQLNVYNPGTLLSSVIDSMLNPGTYYLKIKGSGNIYAPNYASLGSYSLQANFTAGTLPLRRLELHGMLNNNDHQLNWLIDADEQVTRLILEISTDGRNFSTLTETATSARNYSYHPNVLGTVQYRLNVIFDNGRQFYSNVVTIRNAAFSNGPKLISNLVNTGTLEVSSPAVFDYAISDFSGRTLATGKLAGGSNIILSPGVTAGMYIIRFTNETGQWIDKFVRQ